MPEYICENCNHPSMMHENGQKCKLKGCPCAEYAPEGSIRPITSDKFSYTEDDSPGLHIIRDGKEVKVEE